MGEMNIFLGGGGEGWENKIAKFYLGEDFSWWGGWENVRLMGDSHSGKNPVIPYIKTKKENSFQKI